jgi:D-lyxose ketol-isomerase
MRRSEINHLIRTAKGCFETHGWALPPKPRWDVTDFGLGNWRQCGLVLINLCEEPEYCEKLMFALEGMTTPFHTHKKKKEDIICRWGELGIRLSPDKNAPASAEAFVKIDGEQIEVAADLSVKLMAGQRITLYPGTFHEFAPISSECIIGEVSTANDDLTDNVFRNAAIGRFALIDEDEPAIVPLVSD